MVTGHSTNLTGSSMLLLMEVRVRGTESFVPSAADRSYSYTGRI
jgi:hypothetical protein